MFMFVWKKKYDAVTREMGRQIAERDDTLMIREATIGRLQRENAKLLERMAVADNQTMAAIRSRDAIRARLDVVGAELDHWRANGQLRDPKTGRLIPRAKTEAA